MFTKPSLLTSRPQGSGGERGAPKWALRTLAPYDHEDLAILGQCTPGIRPFSKSRALLELAATCYDGGAMAVTTAGLNLGPRKLGCAEGSTFQGREINIAQNNIQLYLEPSFKMPGVRMEKNWRTVR